MSSSRQSRLLDIRTGHFDLLVLGGGITGAGIAREAISRGLRTALLEKGDFASGTSSRSGKLVHGGLRYLKRMRFGMVWEASRERDRLMRELGSDVIAPIRFYLPFFKWQKTPGWLVVIGLFLYDLLSLFRNAAGHSRIIGKERLKKCLPYLTDQDLSFGASYGDGRVLDFRLVVDTLKSAAAEGAKLLNYCEVTSIETSQKGILVRARDSIGGEEISILSPVIVLAAGPWSDELLARSFWDFRFHLAATSGIHLVFRQRDFPLRETVALENRKDKRNLYCVPWGDYVLVGTTDRVFSGDLDNPPVSEVDIDYLLDVLRDYFPKASLGRENIHTSFVGVRPLIGSDKNKKEEDLPRDYELRWDERGLVAITGGKLTTFRAMAKKTLNLVERHFSDRLPERSVPMVPMNNPKPKIENSDPIYPGSKYNWSNIEFMIEHEFAETAEDIVKRRTDLSLFSEDKGARATRVITEFIEARRNQTTKA